MVPSTCPPKKFQLDSKREDMQQSTMFKENIIKLTCCTIIKMLVSRIDKFSAGQTKCRYPMQTRRWWNSPTLLLSLSVRNLNHTQGLTLSTPVQSILFFNRILPLFYYAMNHIRLKKQKFWSLQILVCLLMGVGISYFILFSFIQQLISTASKRIIYCSNN